MHIHRRFVVHIWSIIFSINQSFGLSITGKACGLLWIWVAAFFIHTSICSRCVYVRQSHLIRVIFLSRNDCNEAVKRICPQCLHCTESIETKAIYFHWIMRWLLYKSKCHCTICMHDIKWMARILLIWFRCDPVFFISMLMEYYKSPCNKILIEIVCATVLFLFLTKICILIREEWEWKPIKMPGINLS